MLFAGDNEQWSLPPVVITDKRSKFKMRKADRKLASYGNYSQPYVVMRGMPSQRENVVDYTVQMPYRPWMQDMKCAFTRSRRKPA